MLQFHPVGTLAPELFLNGPCVIGHVDWPDSRSLVDQDLLSAAETTRAAAFRVEPARAAFVLGRSILRQGLSFATGRPAAQIDLVIEPNGRPVAPESGWHFSISHSGPWVAVAFSRRCVGCDLETGASLRRDDLAGMARLVFSPQEITRLAVLQDRPDLQRAFFLTVWCRKEAVLKAAGLGLAGDACAVCVTTPDGLAETVTCAGQTYRVTDISGPDLPTVSLAALVTSPDPTPAPAAPR